MKKLQLVTGFTSSNFKQWLGNKEIRFLVGLNRSIKPSQVTVLAKSIDVIGIQRAVVIAELSFITGKKEWYIIDGQHLYHALMRNGQNIPYVLIEVADKSDLIEKIALLNSSSKSWSISDYVTAWSSLKPDYVKLNSYFETYDLELGLIASILNNQNIVATVGGNGAHRKIKNGTFEIFDEENNVKILDNLTDVLRVVNRQSRIENKYLCSEYISFYRNSKDYNHKLFIKNLKKQKDLLMFAIQESGKLSDFFYKLK